jgi:hypothetical protein
MMAVDDHAINSLKTWYDIAYEELKKEWKTGEYDRLADCPSFKAAHTYREALDVLIKGPQSFNEKRLKSLIDEDLELEELWTE